MTNRVVWDLEGIQNLENAKTCYEKFKGENDINPSKIFMDRSQEFKKFPPRKGWRGAFILINK